MSAPVKYLLSAVLLASCTPEVPPEPASALPALEEIRFPALDSIGPELSNALVTMSSDGRLAFTGAFDSLNRQITIVDSAGKLLSRIGPRGLGPGEFTAVLFMYYGDANELVVLDGPRVIRFAGDGSHLSTSSHMTTVGMAQRVHHDSLDLHLLRIGEDVSTMTPQGVRRVSLTTGGDRLIVPESDSAFRALFTSDLVRRVMVPVMGPDRIVIMNREEYRLQSYDQDGKSLYRFGRDLPLRFLSEQELDARVRGQGPGGTLLPQDRQRRERLAARPQAHITYGVFDPAGRLWVFGNDENEKPFADIFRDSTLLGRLPLPCSTSSLYAPNTVAFAMDRLAFLCLTPDSDMSVRLRVFRVTEAPGGELRRQ